MIAALWVALYLLTALLAYGLLWGNWCAFEVSLGLKFPEVCWRETPRFTFGRRFVLIGLLPGFGLLIAVAICFFSEPRGTFRLRSLDEKDFKFVPMPQWAKEQGYDRV